ncbi:MAG TPA: hypothetical protein VEW28_05215 [Candidatus Kapabacteria bacterium]|nr:hypothetical protein [Candidatus Kapabacteria bacterium]
MLVQATVDGVKPAITLHWKRPTTTTAQHYNRRVAGATGWGKTYLIPAKDSTLTDTAIVRGTEYEYQIFANHTAGGTGIVSFGYIRSGVGVRVGDDPGRCILVVDTANSSYLANGLAQLENDLLAEGYMTTRLDVSDSDKVPDIKHRIDTIYEKDPAHFSTLFLIGHVPVPYSGFLNPDGHPDHFGAWPADQYYGDDDESDWTDGDFDTTANIRLAQRNLVGDGKFDQVTPPVGVVLKIGRVDLANMPSFAMKEKELLSQYLVKDHAYRTGILTAPERALVDDNFGYFGGEAFAASGWRNFSALVGTDSIHGLDWFTTLDSNAYLWAYGCGGGWDQGSSGVGATTDFATKESKAIFTLLFGSYFGDWNVQDNFLRAPLCSKYGLTCMWSGRPYSLFFPMAMGHSTGDAAILTENSIGDYNGNLLGSSLGAWTIHIDLMGDPTLRTRPFVSPRALSATLLNRGDVYPEQLSWTKDSGVIGYNVYRALADSNHFQLLTPAPIDTNSYTDYHAGNDSVIYLVRGVRSETTMSGNYFNLAHGAYAGLRTKMYGAVHSGIDPTQDHISVTYSSDGPIAKVMIDLVADNKLTLEITDVEGRTIATITSGSMTSGVHTFDWNFANISNGLYFVRAVGTDESLSAKILVTK